MSSTIARTGLKSLETRTIAVGFLLVGIVIAVTAVSYVANMTFDYQWLVWIIGVAFMGVALLSLEWPRAYFGALGEVPEGRLQTFLLVSMPLAYVLASQYCGLGLKACNAVCHAVNLSGIGLGAVIAVRLRRGQSIGAFLAPLVILSLVPHCVCHAPINTIWQNVLGGYSPVCGAVPLAVILFAVSALRGARPRLSAALVGVLLGVIVFIAVGNPVFGFPWEGCVG
jgi:hypothetical protein